jgi:hypothetical protein
MVKPRFFADTRDLFKYDLVQALMEGIPGMHRFLFVPMLTRDDGKKGGYHDLAKAKAGYLNRDLFAFLERCNEGKARDVSRIADYFGSRGIDTTIVSRPFTRPGRGEYFDMVLAGICPPALILLDPDNGLEVGQPDEKHLLFPELSSILRAVDDASLVIIFQYYPRVARRSYREGRVREILRRTGHRPLWITDNQILFFLIAKDDLVRTRAAGILDGYSSRYSGLTVGM